MQNTEARPSPKERPITARIDKIEAWICEWIASLIELDVSQIDIHKPMVCSPALMQGNLPMTRRKVAGIISMTLKEIPRKIHPFRIRGVSCSS